MTFMDYVEEFVAMLREDALALVAMALFLATLAIWAALWCGTL